MEKLRISLKYWLLGSKYFKALKAMEFAEKIHIGKRKNGDPEFIHQITIVQFLRTFASGNFLLFPEDTLCVGFLHDTSEDYDISFDEFEIKFGKEVARAIKAMTKKYRGHRIPDSEYYAIMGEDPIASVVKGGDRIHNHQSMVGTFTLEKQKSYIEETEIHILPMLKKARSKFPEQESVYENEKLLLKSQISLIKEIHKNMG